MKLFLWNYKFLLNKSIKDIWISRKDFLYKFSLFLWKIKFSIRELAFHYSNYWSNLINQSLLEWLFTCINLSTKNFRILCQFSWSVLLYMIDEFLMSVMQSLFKELLVWFAPVIEWIQNVSYEFTLLLNRITHSRQDSCSIRKYALKHPSK